MYTYSYRRRSAVSPLFLLVPALLFVLLALFQMVRGLPAVAATTTLPATTVLGDARQLPLPTGGSSSVVVAGLGTLANGGQAVPRPIASVTKVMTAYVILKGHPLKTGETGPTVTITPADAQRYLQMVAQDQSTLPVSAGMVFSQFDLLQGLLIPSANNFAEVLATWDAGSQAAFVQKMNAEAKALGMSNTAYADASGFLPGSVSTAEDQIILARLVMQDPLFAQIVGTQSTRIPNVGTVTNVNQLLGQDGIVGIKTGFTEDAGGNLLFAARRQVGAQTVDIIGAVLGQADRPAAFAATRQVLAPLNQSLQLARVVSAGQAVAVIDPEWGDEVQVVAAQDAQLVLWPGMTLKASVHIEPLRAGTAKDTEVGWVDLELGEQKVRVPVKLAQALPKAGFVWKLTRT